MSIGTFTGVGVGPGGEGLIPVKALEAIHQADLVYLPRSRSSRTSVALECLRWLDLPETKLREIEFTMNPDRDVVRQHYADLGERITADLRAGQNVVYLTLGETMTYSTYGYVLAAVKDQLPEAVLYTIPGVTSYSTIAAACHWPLGEGKERMLILPCPDDMNLLRKDIESHDIVILMKIGRRLPAVLETLKSMKILPQCALGHRIGFTNQQVFPDASQLPDNPDLGYLSTMLIRQKPHSPRHARNS